MSKGWIGVDLDGTLAEYHDWSEEIGAPIPKMVERVRRWLDSGLQVRIFTARGSSGGLSHMQSQYVKIEKWCQEHLGRVLDITSNKDIFMEAIYDDRAFGIVKNTGESVEDRAYKNGYNTGKGHGYAAGFMEGVASLGRRPGY
jgi:hypothetical protein